MASRSQPKHLVAVFVFILKGDRILLVRQSNGRRYWSLPGGRVENGESLEAAAIREVKEETGLKVELTQLVGVYSKAYQDALAITFAGKVIGGKLKASHEILEARYFPLTDLPSKARPHLAARIKDFLAKKKRAIYKTETA